MLRALMDGAAPMSGSIFSEDGSMPVDDRQAFIRGRSLRLAIWLILGGAMLHLALAAGTGLTPDEAHYALYGAHLDWSYFDHPGLVGWLQAPFATANSSDLRMRVVPMASWVLSAALLCALCRKLAASTATSGESAARTDDGLAVALLFLSPLLNLLGVVLVPDSLLMPLVPAAMMATWELRERSALKDWHRWFALALILGLCLLAKYTGVFVVFGSLATLLAFHGPALGRARGAWLAAAVVCLLASPILVWNAQHDWISFVYQTDHAAGDRPWRLATMARALLLQILLFGVLIPACVLRACRSPGGDTPTRPDAARDARRMGLLFGLPVLGVFLVLAGRGSSLPHWTVCGWIALIPLAVTGARSLRRGIVISVVIGQAACIATIVGMIATGGPMSETGAGAISAASLRVSGVRPNPIADLYGWDLAAAHSSDEARRYGARGVVVMNWSLASRLAWYARPLPVFVAPPRLDQFQLWFGALRQGDSAIVVDWSGMPLPIPVGPGGFASCTAIDQLAVIEHGKQVAHFNFLNCHGWAGLGGAQKLAASNAPGGTP